MTNNEDIRNLIEDFVGEYEEKKYCSTMWKKPIVAFADANDFLFKDLKTIIDRSHKMPNELLPNARSIISYFIPFYESVGKSNEDGLIASQEWAISYIETNQLIVDLNEFMKQELNKMGIESYIIPPTHNFDEEKLISWWSHKHVAYIAGLGKFGLHKMIITDKGCCGRLGSIITNMRCEANKRKVEEYCLYFHNKSCGRCIEKCLFNALKIDEFDRKKCYNICLKNAKRYSRLGLADVCGKCVVSLPCSYVNPVNKF